jgi:ABC-type branched-subunit amino acid transport system substrate-binding protein
MIRPVLRSKPASSLADLLVTFCVLGLMVSFGGCALMGQGSRVSEQEQVAYDQAIALLETDVQASEAALEKFIEGFPESGLADDACEHLARIALSEGRADDAFRWLYYITEHYPSGDRVDAARLRLARWEAARDEQDAARELAARVRVSRLGARDQRAYFRLLSQLTDDPVQKIDRLSKLRALTVREIESRTLSPDSPEGLRLERNVESLDNEIDGLLIALDDSQLLRAAASQRGRIPAARIRLLMAFRALDTGDEDRALSLLKQARRHDMSAKDEDRVAQLERRLGIAPELEQVAEFVPTYREAAGRRWPSTDGVVGSIGVVLPLSGRFAPFGQEALRGILLAADVFDAKELAPVVPLGDASEALDDGPIRGGVSFTNDDLSSYDAELDLAKQYRDFEVPPGVRVVVRDSEGRGDRAAEAVRRLAADEEVVAIIGPIFSEESEAAARVASELGVPLLTLSNRTQIAVDRPDVFRLRTTPDDEVKYLVDYAFDELGSQNFAVLYPRNRYGRGMRKRYWDAVNERGGKLVAVASYDSDATDFSDAIRSMIGYDLLTGNERVALQEREDALRRGRRLDPQTAALLREILYDLLGPEALPLPPQVDFDALFIPDAYDKISLIAPQLAFHEVSGPRLLGSSEWNDPELVRVARGHVNGAVIATPFHAESSFDNVKQFVEGYRASFGSEPDTFSSHAFDAARLVLIGIASGNDTRRQLREAMLDVRGYPGASGVTSIGPDGNASKRPFMLGVRRRGIVSLD